MRTSKSVLFAVFSIIVLSVIGVKTVSAQADPQSKVVGNTIPADVQKIIEKSCVNCHTEPGKTLTLSHINLTKWDQYTPKKQAHKAKAMYKAVSKEKMPPKKYRAEFPSSIPTSKEIRTLHKWAESLNPDKK